MDPLTLMKVATVGTNVATGIYDFFNKFTAAWWLGISDFQRIDLDLTTPAEVACHQDILDVISNIFDIYHDSGFWYITMNDDTIIKTNMGDAGEIEDTIETIDISDTLNGTIINIRKQGNYWYVVSSSGVGDKIATIYKFDSNWDYTGEKYDLSGDLNEAEYLGYIASG